MIGDGQRIVAVWAVLIIPFILIGAYLWSQDELGIRFILAYWFPPAILTVIGAIPPPWQLIGLVAARARIHYADSDR